MLWGNSGVSKDKDYLCVRFPPPDSGHGKISPRQVGFNISRSDINQRPSTGLLLTTLGDGRYINGRPSPADHTQRPAYSQSPSFRFVAIDSLQADNLCNKLTTLRLKKKRSVRDVRRYFSSRRVVNRWNSLDQETVDVGSINSFKVRLDKIRKTMMGFFTDSAWSAKP